MKKAITLISFFLALVLNAHENKFINPILNGGYPDPSICRVGDDFYLVNSSFEYFPGLPIHHSKDLINWELIGYGIYNQQQAEGIKLLDIQQRGGIHAPSIRYHEGIYYIITTSVYSPKSLTMPTEMINFVITAKDPAGPWSAPHKIEGAPGIDPDIIFDGDKVWYVGTHAPEKRNFKGEGEIWLQELDINTWKLIGERYYLWRGACGGTWAEGPHIYQKDDKYYLMIAEGGTSYNHSVTIAISDKITGPYKSNGRNPIFSTRHLSYDNWVHSTGHADIVELADGRFYMVTLGIRNDMNGRSNMGRETHMLPIKWEREKEEWLKVKHLWPVCAPQTGCIERCTPVPFAGTQQRYNDAFDDSFDADELNLEWNFRRYPIHKFHSLTDRKGYLRVYLQPTKFALRECYSAMGFRQKESDFEYKASMKFVPKKNGAEAGISFFQQDDNYINMTVRREGKAYKLVLSIAERNKAEYVAQSKMLENYNGRIIFKVKSMNDIYTYYYSIDNGNNYQLFATTSAGLILSNGYTGSYLGVYGTSNGAVTKDYADFDWVSYKGYVRK